MIIEKDYSNLKIKVSNAKKKEINRVKKLTAELFFEEDFVIYTENKTLYINLNNVNDIEELNTFLQLYEKNLIV